MIKFRNQFLKILNYKYLLIEKKNLNFLKNQKKIYVSYICVISLS
jgi:hypothetical protein